MPAWPLRTLRRIWALLDLAGRKFLRIDGPQRAAAFAYNAFFALFPLVILFAACASLFVDRAAAGNSVITYVEKYVPLTNEARHYIFDTVYGTIKARRQAGVAAFLILIWASSQFFTTLVQATNRAWGTSGSRWWHLPLTSLALLAIMTFTVLMGISLPVLGEMAQGFFTGSLFLSWIYGLFVLVLPWLVVFLSLTLFYKMAPRRRTGFAEVWLSALCATALLQAAQTLFVIFLRKFSALKAVYGAFGSIMALLLWIYLSGCIFIFCACLSSAQAELRDAPPRA
ncbi:MAG TPA: YihY/virulence factor BrkB family protein [Elusimicrobiales bacterium]|nr:YihY/virulence factor BrkB family protein [Elusimicrobiales bacterium]